MANVAKDLAQLISQSKSNKTGPYDTQATVKRIEGKTVWVSIPGGVDETPIEKTIDCKAGDKVQVRVSGGRAWITGNATAPPTDDATAVQAQTVATYAQGLAVDAKETADAVEDIALSAQQSASTAAAAAAQAVLDAGAAQSSANAAQASADSAADYAARALGNLSTVQSVAETLTWITQHGTMTLTSDVSLDPTHVYFVVDAGGDYTVGGTTYAIVTEPDVADIGTYYELSIDESLNNYVGTHLALDTEGLWLLPASSGTNKVLIATGAGSTYTTAGTYIIDSGGTIMASFRANGATIGEDTTNKCRTEITAGGMKVIRDVSGTDTQIANMGYGNSEGAGVETTKPFYTLGTRKTTTAVYDPASTYSLGDLCIYNDKLYVCKTAITTPEAWTSLHWQLAVGSYSLATGEDVIASGQYSIASGNLTTALGYWSYAGGYASKATQEASFAHGHGVSAYAKYAHAEGIRTLAYGEASHAQNEYNYARGKAQTVLGSFAVADSSATTTHPSGDLDYRKYAAIVGNGTADNARSNALTVDWSGNVEAAGEVICSTNDKGLTGTLSDGSTQRNMIGMSTADNVVVNYAGYTNADSGTNIYGDTVRINSNHVVPVNVGMTMAGYPSGLLAEDVVLDDDKTISGSNYGNGSLSVAKTGFTPIGIVGMHLQNATNSGSNNTLCAVHSFYLSGTTAYWIVRNTGSSQAKIKVTATILYAKS